MWFLKSSAFCILMLAGAVPSAAETLTWTFNNVTWDHETLYRGPTTQYPVFGSFPVSGGVEGSITYDASENGNPFYGARGPVAWSITISSHCASSCVSGNFQKDFNFTFTQGNSYIASFANHSGLFYMVLDQQSSSSDAISIGIQAEQFPAEGGTVAIIGVTAYRTVLATDISGNPFYMLQIVTGGAGSLSSSPRPSPPINLRTTQIGNSGNEINLTWDYGSDQIDGFKIYRKAPLEPWPLIPFDSISSSSAPYSYSDDTVPSEYATYSYRIKAYKGDDESVYSNIHTAFQLKLAGRNCPSGKTALGPAIGPCTNPRPWPQGMGTDNIIIADFLPDSNPNLASLRSVAKGNGQPETGFGYDHFNWISKVTLPPSVTKFAAANAPSISLSGTFTDPPLGGYTYHLDDCLPYYLDEQAFTSANCLPPFLAGISLSGPSFLPSPDANVALNFHDGPHSTQLEPTDYIQFVTTLVGVIGPVGTSNVSDPLASFVWRTNNRIVGVEIVDVLAALAGVEATSATSTGGIFNVELVSPALLPASIRESLAQDGVQGLPTGPIPDTTAPVTAWFLSGLSSSNGWYSGPVTVTLIATDVDGPADIASTSYSVDGVPVMGYYIPFSVSGDGIHTIQFASVDRAGNTEVPLPPQSIMIDGTAPTTTAPANEVAPQTIPGGAIVNYPSPTIIETGSGIASSGCLPVSGSTFPVGLTTVACTATDLAGNTASATFTVTVNAVTSAFHFTGFFQPVDNLPTRNVIKAGQAVPVKFSLGGDVGLNIFAAGFPKVQLYQCNASAALDTIEQTLTAGGSSLTYSAVTQQYTYVWKTDKTWAGTCRQLIVGLSDGSMYTANFSLSK